MNIEEAKSMLNRLTKDNISLTFQDEVEAIETVLSELEEYEKALNIFDEREYRKKYLEEERAIRPKLLYPDADEIYQKYFQQRAELEKKDKVINEMADKLHRLALYYDDEGTYCELRHEECDELNNVKDIHKHCTNCIKEHFTNKVEREGK